MSWEVDKDEERRVVYSTKKNKISVYFKGGLTIEVFETQEDGEEMLMYKKFIGPHSLGLAFQK